MKKKRKQQKKKKPQIENAFQKNEKIQNNNVYKIKIKIK